MTTKLSTGDVIRELLKTFNDAATPGGAGQGIRTSGADDAVLWMSREWHEGSYAQLEQALKRMRNQGSQQAVEGIPLRTLWWHIDQRYIRVERRRRLTYKTTRKGGKTYILKDKNGNPIEDPKMVEVYTREYAAVPKAKQELCERLGIGWLVAEFDRMGVVPFLPSETWERVAA